MDKKIIIAVVAVVAVIAIAISVFLITKNTNTIYTISFNTDGGNEVVSQQVEKGKTITKPADPSKEGYEFLGWYLNGVYFDFETEVEENLTLDAKWKEIVKEDNTEIKDDEKVEEDNKDNDKEEVTKYTVKFDVDGKITKKTVEKNKTVKAPADPTKEGYKFLGWYLGNTKYNFSKKVTKNITLTAKWEKVEEQKPEEEKPNTQPEEQEKPVVKEYTVKFDVDGKITTKTVKEGEKVSKPSDPQKDGYTFKYWSLNGSEYNFSNEVKADITLKAEWKKNDVVSYYISDPIKNSVFNQVKVYLTLNGEHVAGTATIVNTQGKTIRREIPKEGWLTVAGTVVDVTNITVTNR